MLAHEFPDIYGSFRCWLLELTGILQIADEDNFDSEGYFIANPDVQAAANGDESYAINHFRAYRRAKDRKQRVFPDRSVLNSFSPEYEGPFRVGFADAASIPIGAHFSCGRAPKLEALTEPERHDAQTAFDGDSSLGAERLTHLGFFCLKPHELDFAEQVRTMSRGEIIIGQFGAALWNIAFAPPGGVVIEIGVDSYSSNEYLYLSQIKGLRFIRVMTHGEMERSEAARGGIFSFAAPIDAVEKIVVRLLGPQEKII